MSVMFCTVHVLLFSDGGDKGALRLEVCSMHAQDTAAVYLPCTFCLVLYSTIYCAHAWTTVHSAMLVVVTIMHGQVQSYCTLRDML